MLDAVKTGRGNGENYFLVDVGAFAFFCFLFDSIGIFRLQIAMHSFSLYFTAWEKHSIV